MTPVKKAPMKKPKPMGTTGDYYKEYGFKKPAGKPAAAKKKSK